MGAVDPRGGHERAPRGVFYPPSPVLLSQTAEVGTLR